MSPHHLDTATSERAHGEQPPRDGALFLSKVPQITALFWVIKVLTTGMGEAASDWTLNRGEGLPGLGIAGALGLNAAIFVVALVLQFSGRRYVPAVYWFAVAAVSVFGTVAADLLHFIVGVPLWASTTLYAGALTATFGLWYLSEKTLSIHSITTRRREAFYWTAVFLTFALGTALGDLTAMVWNWGFLVSGVMFAVLIAVPAIAHRRFGLNAVAAFWFAYVVTRPLGASFADWFGAPADEGGLGFGFGPVALIMTVVIVGLVGHVHRTREGDRGDGSIRTRQGR